MNTTLLPKKIELLHHHPENFILVENADDGGVVIHAAINNFSERRKGAFIRELSAEGFIPDHLQWYSDADIDSPFTEVKWMVDQSWIRVHSILRQRSKRAVLTMLAVASSILLLVMSVAILQAG